MGKKSEYDHAWPFFEIWGEILGKIKRVKKEMKSYQRKLRKKTKSRERLGNSGEKSAGVLSFHGPFAWAIHHRNNKKGIVPQNSAILVLF